MVCVQKVGIRPSPTVTIVTGMASEQAARRAAAEERSAARHLTAAERHTMTTTEPGQIAPVPAADGLSDGPQIRADQGQSAPVRHESSGVALISGPRPAGTGDVQ